MSNVTSKLVEPGVGERVLLDKSGCVGIITGALSSFLNRVRIVSHLAIIGIPSQSRDGQLTFEFVMATFFVSDSPTAMN